MNVIEIKKGEPYFDKMTVRVRGRYIYFDVEIDQVGATFRAETDKVRSIIKRTK